MVAPEQLFTVFKKNDFDFFTGVPDSTYNGWMSFLEDEQGKRLTNVVAVNECEATAIGAGYHLATGKYAVIYMQNAGFGKTVNPITSLCDKEVYNIPVLLMIGWRGEPDKKDEPQHKKMGRIMIPLLNALEIPYAVLENKIEEIEKEIEKAKSWIAHNNAPYAIIIRSGLVDEYVKKVQRVQDYEMAREDAIKTIINNLNGSEVIVSTTGKTSRELFEYRVARKEKPRDFYTVGSMGCAGAIAFGIALQKKDKKVFVLDGDGAALMEMGSLATIGNYAPENFYHFIIDNNAHDSTGGQPTSSNTVDFQKIALSVGYKEAQIITKKDDLQNAMKDLTEKKGPLMIIVKVRKGSRKDLGRPTTTPVENKKKFMEFIK